MEEQPTDLNDVLILFCYCGQTTDQTSGQRHSLIGLAIVTTAQQLHHWED